MFVCIGSGEQLYRLYVLFLLRGSRMLLFRAGKGDPAFPWKRKRCRARHLPCLRSCDGVQPKCWRTYLPKKDRLGKLRMTHTSFIGLSVLHSR